MLCLHSNVTSYLSVYFPAATFTMGADKVVVSTVMAFTVEPDEFVTFGDTELSWTEVVP